MGLPAFRGLRQDSMMLARTASILSGWASPLSGD